MQTVSRERIKKPRLNNAKEMSLEFPDKFYYWEEEIKQMKVGDVAKVANSRERFWTVIREINGNNIIASVDNGLIATNLNYKDLISYRKENIYEVWDVEELKRFHAERIKK